MLNQCHEKYSLTTSSVYFYLQMWYTAAKIPYQHQTPQEIRTYVCKKYAEQAKLHDVSPHDLRHRFGYRMAGTVPLHRLAQLMGHDSLDTTMLYAQGTKDDLQQAVETIAWT